MEETPQIPSQPQPPSEPSFWDKINSDAKELWAKNKLFFILFGMLILVVKFRDVIIDILLNSSKNVLTKAQDKDQSLAQQENDANTKANDLVKKANELPNSEKPIDDDWNKS